MQSNLYSCIRADTMKVEKAITREKKERTMEKLRVHFNKSTLGIGIRFQGVSVAGLQEFRRLLPVDASFVIAKNTLIRKVSSEMDGWSEFGQYINADSGVLFVGESVADVMKVYDKFVETLDKSG